MDIDQKIKRIANMLMQAIGQSIICGVGAWMCRNNYWLLLLWSWPIATTITAFIIPLFEIKDLFDELNQPGFKDRPNKR